MISVEEAARQRGVSPQRIRQLLAENDPRVRGTRVGGTWIVFEDGEKSGLSEHGRAAIEGEIRSIERELEDVRLRIEEDEKVLGRRRERRRGLETLLAALRADLA